MSPSTLRRRELLALAIAAPAAAGKAFAQARGPESGPFEVTSIDRMDLVDRGRGRTIATRAYVPAAPSRHPVIIFSHGFGGSLATFGNTGRIWASHGYVVIHPTHADSLAMMDPSVPATHAAVMRRYLAERPNPDPVTRLALVKLLDDPFFIESRLRDVDFLVRALNSGAALDPIVLERADTARVGMGGHSFGAYTTLVIAGSTLVPPPNAPAPAGFSAFLSVSGQGPGRMRLTEDSFATIAHPLMCTTGTLDFGAAGETPPWRLKPFDLSPPGRKYAIVVESFRHSDFDPPTGDPERGVLGAALRRCEVQFWDAFLRGDLAAKSALDDAARASAKGDALWVRSR